MSKRKKIILIASAVFVVIFLIGCYIVFSISSHNSNIGPNSEPERGGTPVVSLNDPNNTLYSSFTIDFYQAIKLELSSFIKTQHGNTYDTVTISDVKVPVRQGDTTTFKAAIPSLKQTYAISVTIPYDINSQPTFSIPAINYSVPLNVPTN